MKGSKQQEENARRNKVTIRDIARLANVAPSTVSRALSGQPGVSEATRARLLQVAKDMGYEVPPVEGQRGNRRRRGRLGKTIGLVWTNTPATVIYQQWEANVLAGIVSRAGEENCRVVVDIIERGGDVAKAADILDSTTEGIIVMGSRPDQPIPDWMRAQPSRIVFVQRNVVSANISSVLANDRRGGFLAAEYLAKLGHRDIALISHSTDASEPFVAREQGFREGLRQFGLDVPPEWTLYTHEWGFEPGRAAADRLLRLDKLPTAIFAATDRFAIGALQRLTSAGLSVPDDISIVGFDDIELSSLVDPPLTTVRLPMFEIGREAAGLLLHLQSEKEYRPRQVYLEVQLVVRDTSGPPAK